MPNPHLWQIRNTPGKLQVVLLKTYPPTKAGRKRAVQAYLLTHQIMRKSKPRRVQQRSIPAERSAIQDPPLSLREVPFLMPQHSPPTAHGACWSPNTHRALSMGG